MTGLRTNAPLCYLASSVKQVIFIHVSKYVLYSDSKASKKADLHLATRFPWDMQFASKQVVPSKGLPLVMRPPCGKTPSCGGSAAKTWRTHQKKSNQYQHYSAVCCLVWRETTPTSPSTLPLFRLATLCPSHNPRQSTAKTLHFLPMVSGGGDPTQLLTHQRNPAEKLRFFHDAPKNLIPLVLPVNFILLIFAAMTYDPRNACWWQDL